MAILRNCLVCKKDFFAKFYLIRDGFAKYCSKKCYAIGRTGKTMKNKGRPLSLEHRAKLSGPNANNWQGGKSTKNEIERKRVDYRIWRIAIFTRDNYTCQICNKKGGHLHADHVKPFALYPELRLAIDNGRTLCVSCHMKTETWGYKKIYAIKN